MYRDTLEGFLVLVDDIASIRVDTSEGSTAATLEPCWQQRYLFMPPLDAPMLYSFIALTKPRRYI